jgi:hypothetical protein
MSSTIIDSTGSAWKNDISMLRIEIPKEPENECIKPIKNIIDVNNTYYYEDNYSWDKIEELGLKQNLH